MTLLVSFIATLIFLFIWYFKDYKNRFQTLTMSIVFGAATLMWFVDAIFEYASLGSEAYFNPSIETMTNDLFLGLCVVILGLIIYFILLIIKDPLNYRKKESK